MQRCLFILHRLNVRSLTGQTLLLKVHHPLLSIPLPITPLLSTSSTISPLLSTSSTNQRHPPFYSLHQSRAHLSHSYTHPFLTHFLHTRALHLTCFDTCLQPSLRWYEGLYCKNSTYPYTCGICRSHYYWPFFRDMLTQPSAKQWDLPLHLRYRDYESRLQSFKTDFPGSPNYKKNSVQLGYSTQVNKCKHKNSLYIASVIVPFKLLICKY